MTANAARSSTTPMVVFFLSMTKEARRGRSGGYPLAGRRRPERRDGIKTARMQRRAFDESYCPEHHSDDHAMSPDCLGGVVRATGRKATAARRAKNDGQGRRERALIETNQQQ